MSPSSVLVANCRHLPQMSGGRFEGGKAYTHCLHCNAKLVQPIGEWWQLYRD